VSDFFQTDPTIGFDPATPATYTFEQTPLLPSIDVAQCLAFQGTNLMVGGKLNVIYPWDTTSPTFSYPIFLAENNIQQMITINTNTYCLVGNRGRIYVTNGSQSQLYKKVPDHISGTIEPYFIWGGLTSTKNQLYFSCYAVQNSGSQITNNTAIGYGAVWAIDIDTEAMRITNKLSYDTYLGYCSAMIYNASTNPSGAGLIIGWCDGSGGTAITGNYGIDISSASLYTGSQATIDSDLIPIGTFDKPRDMARIEYRLTKPMTTGESVTIQYRTDFSQVYTTVLTDSYVSPGQFSTSGPINFKNAQWVQFRIILNGGSSSPSYTRLKEIRITGMQGQTMVNAPSFSV